jgi:transcriptional regulator with XRE-family HTH domain
MGVDLDKIRSLREKLKLSQEAAAIKAGFTSRQAWYKIESGQQEPLVSTLERIAKALGVKAKDLLQ